MLFVSLAVRHGSGREGCKLGGVQAKAPSPVRRAWQAERSRVGMSSTWHTERPHRYH